MAAQSLWFHAARNIDITVSGLWELLLHAVTDDTATRATITTAIRRARPALRPHHIVPLSHTSPAGRPRHRSPRASLERAARVRQAGAVTSTEQAGSGPGRGREPSEARQYPGQMLRIAGDYGWRLLVVGTVGYFSLKLLVHLGLVVIPFLVSLLVTALLHPIMAFFTRRGLGRAIATLATVLVAVVLLGGLITLVVIRAAEQAPQLGNEINNLVPHIKRWLITGPLRLNPTTVNNLSKRITDEVTKNSSLIASTALSTGKAALEVLGGLALVIFSTIFLLYDGARVWGSCSKGRPPRPGRASMPAAGPRGRH